MGEANGNTNWGTHDSRLSGARMSLLGVPLLVACTALALAPSAFGWSARTVPGLVSGGGSGGPLVPVVGGVVLDGKNGLSTSLQPTLRWPDAPSGQKQFEVLDLAGRSLWRFGSASGDARVNPGVLKQGGAYRWRATGSGKSYDGGIFRVDMQRASVQAAPSFSGVAVGAVSGETAFSWSSNPLGSGVGQAGYTLALQPSNTQLQEQVRGLPAGWQMVASAGSDWTRVRYMSADWVELISSTGIAIPFSRGSGGLWVAQLGTGQGWPTGSQVSLSQASDGTFSATDRNGVVALFPAFKKPKAGSEVYARKVWAAGVAALQLVYGSTGRLKALQDPVSGRSIKFIYRGVNETSELKCVEPKARHMTIAPAGYLCLTSGWEEPVGRRRPQNYKPQRNLFFYAKDGSRLVLARIVGNSQAGGQLSSVTDMAYDQVGRLKAVRSPLATQAVAAGVLPGKPGADDPNVLTTISYDSAGRVSRVTRPAPLSCCGRTGPRAWRSFTWSAGDGQVTQTVSGPGAPRALSRTTSQLSTMFTVRAEDSSGAATTTEWDPALEAPTRIDSPGGFRQLISYDQLGNPVEQKGPSTQVDSSSASVSTTSYDTEMDGTTEKPLRGLQAFYFRGREYQGAPLIHQTGPKIDSDQPVSSLQFSWPSSPIAATTRDWSARLMGYVRVPQDGDFKFSAGQGTSLWISGQLCSPECSREGLKADQLLAIQVQVASATNGSASVAVLWSGPGASGAIPSTNLRPGYTRPSRQKVVDSLSPGAGTQTLSTALEYNDRGTAQLVAATSTTGKRVERAYEPFNPQAGQFGRPVKSANAAGTSSSTTYYGQHDMVAVPNACPTVGGQVQDQAGLPRTRSLPGGLSTTQVYDNAGRVTAQSTNGRLTNCTSFDAAGDAVLSYAPADGASAAVTASTTYNAGGNPLVTETVTSQAGNGPRKVRGRVDILGRAVASTDVWGTTTTTIYDGYDRPVKVSSTTGSGQTTVTETAYNEEGELASMKVDGRTLATYAYNDAGQLSSVSYGNGATVSLSYDSSGNIVERTLKVGGQEIKESVGLSPGGRVLSHSIDAPGADAQWGYSYDRDGRLTSAELSGTVPAGASTGTWAYELNDASQRTAITRPGSGPGSGRNTFVYGGAGEMEGTSDSRFGPQGDAQFEYDDLDRATKAGPLSFKYDATGAVRQVSDGTTTVDYQLAGGAVIGQTTTTTDKQTGQKSSKSVRYSEQGLILCPRCDKGTAIKRIVELGAGVTVELPVGSSARSSRAQASGEQEASAAQAVTASGLWRYADILGSVAWQATGSDAPAQTALYDPDGNQLTTDPPLLFDPTSPNLRFEGTETTPTEIPTIAMGSRLYIPALGIFMQPDPVPNGGPTAYNYANGDPVNFADPSGDLSWCWSTFTKITAAVVVGAVVGVLTGNVGAGAAVGKYVAAQVAIGAAAGAAGSAAGQGIVIGFEIKDTNGKVQESFNWSEFWRDAAIGAASSAVAARGAGWVRTKSTAQSQSLSASKVSITPPSSFMGEIRDSLSSLSRQSEGYVPGYSQALGKGSSKSVSKVGSVKGSFVEEQSLKSNSGQQLNFGFEKRTVKQRIEGTDVFRDVEENFFVIE